MENFGINGLLGLSDEELSGKARSFSANPRAFRKVLKSAKRSPKAAVNTASAPAAASRAEMIERFDMLTPELQQGLRDGKYQYSDAGIYITKSVSALTSIKMFQDADDKIVGVSNIGSGKLEKNEVFLCTGIQVLYALGANTAETKAGIAALTEDWKVLPRNLANGEFSFRAAGRTLMERVSNSIFTTHFNVTTDATESAAVVGASSTVNGEGLPGYYKLANPKMIKTLEPMELDFDFVAAAPSNSFIKVVMFGTKIMTH